MKIKTLLGLLFILLLLFSCTGLFDHENEKIEGEQAPEALIHFMNNNYFDVDVFMYYDRTGDKYTVPAGEHYPSGINEYIPWSKSDGYMFYFTYYFPIGDNKIPYIPPSNNLASSSVHIIPEYKPPDYEIARIDIPEIDYIIPLDQDLFNDVFISIKNNSTTLIRLHKGGSIIEVQVNGNNSIQGSGRTGLYKVPFNSLPSDYKIFISSNLDDSLSLPISNFTAGYLYEIELALDGKTTTLKSENLITLGYLIPTLSQAKLNIINTQRSLKVVN